MTDRIMAVLGGIGMFLFLWLYGHAVERSNKNLIGLMGIVARVDKMDRVELEATAIVARQYVKEWSQ